jgi:hypothetical protein
VVKECVPGLNRMAAAADPIRSGDAEAVRCVSITPANLTESLFCWAGFYRRMEGERSIRWGCVVGVFAVLAGAIGFQAWFNHAMVLSASGREYPPQGQELWLKEGLASHFRWTGLPENSIEKVWIDGFQDHTYLYRIRLSPEQFADLRQAVLANTAEGVRVEGYWFGYDREREILFLLNYTM